MGLDITAYRRLATVNLPHDADAYSYGARKLFKNQAFPGRADDIDEDAAYVSAEPFDFRAGSYGGYNDWREQLAKFAGYPPGATPPTSRHVYTDGASAAEIGPFWELINFSDCEGVIGTAISAKLAKDFADWQAKADTIDGPDADWFKARYADWRKAFEMAADGGAVDFH